MTAASSSPSTPSVLVFMEGGQVGDMVNLLPAIRRFRDSFPGHHICWLTSEGTCTLSTSLHELAADYIDEFINDSKICSTRIQFFSRPLKGRRFSIIIDTQTRLRATVPLRRVPHDLFISATGKYRFSSRKPASGTETKVVLDRFAQLVELASGKPLRLDFDTVLPDGYREAARALLPTGVVYVGLAPGAGAHKKRWSLDNYIEVAKSQVECGRTPVFFMDRDDDDVWSIVRSAVPTAIIPERHPDITVSRGPLLAIALAERMAISVANDSGIGHLLGASRRPLVTLFGPTNLDKFTIQSASRWVPISAGQFGGTQVDEIPVVAVKEAIDEVLTRDVATSAT